PDGQSLVSGGQDGTIKVWEVGSRPDPNTLTDFKGGIDTLAISLDGTTLAVGDYFDKTVKLYDMSSRQRVAVLRDEMPVWFVTFAPGAQYLATGTYGTILLWDLATKEQMAKFQLGSGSGVYSASFSPDGKLLAAGGSTGLLVWETATRQQVA